MGRSQTSTVGSADDQALALCGSVDQNLVQQTEWNQAKEDPAAAPGSAKSG